MIEKEMDVNLFIIQHIQAILSQTRKSTIYDQTDHNKLFSSICVTDTVIINMTIPNKNVWMMFVPMLSDTIC